MVESESERWKEEEGNRQRGKRWERREKADDGSNLHVDGHVHIVAIRTRTRPIETHLTLTPTGEPAVLLLVTTVVSIPVGIVLVLFRGILVVSFQKGPAA